MRHFNMFRRNYRKYELEATRARDGGYVVRLLRKGAIVHILGGDQNGQCSFEDPESALAAGVEWIERNFLKAGPRYKGEV